MSAIPIEERPPLTGVAVRGTGKTVPSVAHGDR